MEEEKVENVLRGEFNCDECARRHKKCDRKLPSCSYCISKKKACTKNRKLVNRKKLYQLEDKLYKYKLNKNQKKESIQPDKRIVFKYENPKANLNFILDDKKEV
ncbi:hypothetical protein K502DRAFT_350721 [Neoconidiobolus thromboides FSU 785]|nr:hypothetical protein K502DRAFT_350721 [Neoconidiobolus thromboides FSU 785]